MSRVARVLEDAMRLSVLVSVLIWGVTAAAANDRYAGYYYPPVTSEESFERVIRNSPDAGKSVRVDFVTSLTASQLAAPESPRFVFFAKGSDSDKLILVALDDEVFKTLYRARAILAQMTSNMRNGNFFRDGDLQYIATFFDMLQMLGFDTMVISDGENWSHQVNFIQD